MFECEHCHTQYTSNRFYKLHLPKCKILIKKKESKSIIGRTAFSYYKQWLESKKCYNTEFETFFNSKYYTSFIRFSKYAITKRVPDIQLFIKFVNIRKIQPNMWSSDIVYSSYIKYIDTVDPLRSIGISISALKRLAKIFDCDIDEVLLKLHLSEIIELLYSRHLNPWFLLNSTHISTILTDPNITEHQHNVLEMFINPSKWSSNFEKHKSEVIEIKKYLELLNL